MQRLFRGDQQGDQRNEQISSLKSAIPGIVQNTNDTFQVPIQLAGGQTVNMRIYLPPTFPETKPELQMLQRIQHPWLNTFCQVIGHPSLHNWNSNCSLTTVVLDVMNQFAGGGQLQPSAARQQQPSAAGGQREYSASNPFANQGNPSLQRVMSTRDSHHHTPMPPIPFSFPELENAPITQLNRLLNDDVAFDAYFNAMEPVIDFKALHRDLLKGNADMAKSNLEEGEKLDSLHAEILSLQATLAELKSTYEGTIKENGMLQGDNEILAKVKHAASQADTSSEELAQNFEGGTYSEDQINVFIDTFMENRCRYHQLSAKMESTSRA